MKYIYPKDYQAQSIEVQAEILEKYFKRKLPYPVVQKDTQEGEALFFIPHFKLIAPTYNQAVEIILGWLKESRPFYNWREGKLGPEYLRQTEKKALMWENAPEIGLVIPCQLGEAYAGKSVQDAKALFKENEIGLGAYEGAIIALTHPKRFETVNELDMDLPGDEYNPGGDLGFSSAPSLYFNGGKVKFSSRWFDFPDVSFGSASGFVPQSLLAPRTLETVVPLPLASAKIKPRKETTAQALTRIADALEEIKEKMKVDTYDNSSV